MYKDLSLKEKAKVLLYGGKLGLTSVEDIAKLYDDAIGHTFQTKGLMQVDAVSGPDRLYEKDPYKSKTGYFQYWLEGRNNQLENAAINYRKKFPLVRFRKGNSIEELTSKIKNDYLSGINNVEEYIIPFIDDWIKPQYKGFLNARVDENAKMKALNHYNTILKLLGLPETNDVNKAFLYLSNGNNGITLPDLGAIYYPETYTEALYNKNKGNSTLIHERNHAGDVANYRIQDMIFDDRVNETGRKFSYDAIRRQDYHKNGVKYDSYLDSDDEIHSRLMEFRFNNNLNPYKTYTIEEIRNMRNNKDTKDSKLFDRYNDEFMYHLLNDVVQNNIQQEELSHYASKGGSIVSPYGQWKYPGKDTIIPSNNITMANVNYPVLGVSDAGDTKVMMPWNDYKFKGSMVYEHPLIGNQFQLGGNTKPTFDLWYPTVPNQKNDTSSYDLRRAYNTLPFDEMEKFRTINDYHLPSVAYDKKTDTYTFLKRNGHPTLNYELDWYNSGSPDAQEFRERYKLDTLSLPWRYIPNYAKGGSIHIKPENRGKFTALKKRTGHSASWFKAHGTPALKKMATFELNARHWKHDEGGHLFLEDGQIFKRPQDDLTGRNILTSPILPPKSWYELFTIPELEPKKPQPLQPLEGTYGNKYSELIPMSDGTYVNNQINKGLQLDWRTHALEFAPFLTIGAGPAIGSTATWLAASKPALYNLGRMTLGSEIGGRSVDLASNLFTGNTWGLNVGNVVEGITGWNPNNTMIGQFVTDLTNPGYSIGLGKNIKLKKDIDPNRLFSYSEAEYIKPEDFPQVNIFKNQKPKLDVENYLQKHKQRIVDKYGEDAYNKIKLYTYNQDEKSIKRAIRDAIWDDTHNLIYALDNNFINLKYKELAKQPAFNIGRQAIVVNPELTKKIYPSVFELYGDDAALGLIKSHELEHAINWYRQMHPDQKATNGLFDLTKILKDSTKNYFEKQYNTELSARGSLIKDYFDSDIISGDLLRFAARNYVKDTGIDNDMTAFFNGIKDWDGMAKWITKNSSIIATPFLIGNIINKYDKDLKNNQIYY